MNDQELLQACNKYLIYNPVTGTIINRIDRGNVKAGNQSGGLDSHGYLRLGLNRKEHSIHRIAFLMYYGYLPKMIDHINGDKLDNRIDNLRGCTCSQNNRNKKATGKSIYVGVGWSKVSNMWRSRITVNGIRLHLGLFDDEYIAHQAYLSAAKKHGVIDFVYSSNNKE